MGLAQSILTTENVPLSWSLKRVSTIVATINSIKGLDIADTDTCANSESKITKTTTTNCCRFPKIIDKNLFLKYKDELRQSCR